jgi:RNA polymerase sigma-70 factor (ECF subfamily)
MENSSNDNEKKDEELMFAYVEKSEIDAFTVLYHRYERRLFQFFYRRLSFNREEAANDLFQLTWLKVHQYKKRFDVSQKFSTWLFTVAVNTLRDYLRQKRWTREISASDNEASFGAVDAPIDSHIERQSHAKVLEEILEVLTPLQREVILLIDGEDLASKEVAKILNISDTAVRQHLFKARAKLSEFRKDGSNEL